MKKIGVVTGTRAEYGLLKPLIEALDKSENLQLQLMVTGMHLMPEFGNTYLQIEKDGFHIDAKIDDGLNGDSAISITKAMGNGLVGFANALKNLKPDMIIVLGDRSEIFAAVTAAMMTNIPVAHIHGGETTEGAYDEFIRHAITKMSHLHFTSTATYRNRVIQLGEHPSRVFNVGAIGVDSIRQVNFLDKETFEESISKKLDRIAVLITFHPVTLENATAASQFGELLKALDIMADTTLIFTKPNSDRDGRMIIKMIDEYVTKNHQKAVAFTSLGQLRYLSALKHVDFVIGNSSSGILEVPYFKIPTIDIGDRQKGRLAAESVIHCSPKFENINEAIIKARTKIFLSSIQDQPSLYGDGHATEKIIEQIKLFDVSNIKKSFYDLNPKCFEKF